MTPIRFSSLFARFRGEQGRGNTAYPIAEIADVDADGAGDTLVDLNDAHVETRTLDEAVTHV